jgi:hypothetical protein
MATWSSATWRKTRLMRSEESDMLPDKNAFCIGAPCGSLILRSEMKQG